MSSLSRSLPVAVLLLAAACGDSPSGPAPTPSPSATPVPVPPAVSADGLVLLMHMDEPGWAGAVNEVVDASRLGHHGTSLGGATTAAPGRFGRAGSFPGGTGCVTVPDRSDLRPDSALSISAWLNANAVGTAALGVIAKRTSFLVDSAYALYVDESGRLGIDVDTEDNRFFSAPVVSNGRWTHVAIVYDGGASRVTAYVNGAPAAASAVPGRAIDPFRSPLWIGCLPLNQPAQGFSGLLDEVAIWHRVLSAGEVSALASATAPIANP